MSRTFSNGANNTVERIDPAAADVLDDQVLRFADQLYEVHFFCPERGRYLLSPDKKTVSCSVHGNALSPRQPSAPGQTNASSKLMRELTNMTATLSFMEDGLRAVVTVDRR